MVKQVKAYKILKGVRGQNPRDVDSIVEAIVKLSHLAIEHPQINELDINPLIVGTENQGCFVADAKIMLAGT